MSRAAEERQNQLEIIREEYRDTVNIWRPSSRIDDSGLTTDGVPTLLHVNIPLKWVNRRTFTANQGINFTPDPHHDSTDEILMAGQLDLQARDILDVITPNSPGHNFILVIQGEPEPFFRGFNQVAAVVRWSMRPFGVIAIG